MFEASLLGDRAQMIQHRCADTLLLIIVRDHESDFGFVWPCDPIARSGDNRHSEVVSDKTNQGDLTDKIAIHERRDFFVSQVMLRLQEPIEE
jgi:hypothetical protein